VIEADKIFYHVNDANDKMYKWSIWVIYQNEYDCKTYQKKCYYL